MNIDIWIGKKVICISNGFQVNPIDISLSIGEVVRVEYISLAKNPILIIRDEKGEEKLAFSTTIEYTEELWNSLNKLTAKERYELVMAIVNRFQSHHFKNAQDNNEIICPTCKVPRLHIAYSKLEDKYRCIYCNTTWSACKK